MEQDETLAMDHFSVVGRGRGSKYRALRNGAIWLCLLVIVLSLMDCLQL